jgi:hypothetical protein
MTLGAKGGLVDVEFFVSGKPFAFTRSVAAKAGARAIYNRARQANGDMRAARGGLTSPEQAEWRSAVATAYLVAVLTHPQRDRLPREGEPTGAVGLFVDLYGTKGDLDNLFKEVADALEGVAYPNDRVLRPITVDAPDRVISVTGQVSYPKPDRGGKQGAHIIARFYDIPAIAI